MLKSDGMMDFGSGMQILAEPEMQQFAEERRILEREEVGAVQSAGEEYASILEMRASHFIILVMCLNGCLISLQNWCIICFNFIHV